MILRALLISLFLLFPQAGHGCTIFLASDGKSVFVGNNEDNGPDVLKGTRLWFNPAKAGRFGYVTWGSKLKGLASLVSHKRPEGGMNEKGLFLDAAALGYAIPIVKQPGRKDWEGYIINEALETCSSVEDVLRFVGRHNLVWQERAQILVADASGDYAIIHANFIERKSHRKGQANCVLTNFDIHKMPGRKYKCERYDAAQRVLRGGAALSETKVARALQASLQHDPKNHTLYSTICDLENARFTVLFNREFNAPIAFDLKEELKRGKRVVRMPELVRK